MSIMAGEVGLELYIQHERFGATNCNVIDGDILVVDVIGAKIEDRLGSFSQPLFGLDGCFERKLVP